MDTYRFAIQAGTTFGQDDSVAKISEPTLITVK
jgi:hypothetical protein